MKENKDQPGNVSSCFEGQACAEMMRKIRGKEGIGSLCEEIMRSLMKECCETKEVTEEKNDQESETAQGKDKDQ